MLNAGKMAVTNVEEREGRKKGEAEGEIRGQ